MTVRPSKTTPSSVVEAVEDRLTAMLHLKLWRKVGISAMWGRKARNWGAPHVLLEYREVPPPTTQEIATFILKARRPPKAVGKVSAQALAFARALRGQAYPLAPKLEWMIGRAYAGFAAGASPDDPSGRLARRSRGSRWR